MFGQAATKQATRQVFYIEKKFSNVGKRFVKLGLVWTVAAQLEVHVPCGFDDSDRKLQQLEPDGVDPFFSHGLRQGQATEPVEGIVRQCVNLNPVGIDDHGRTADIAHVKAGFALLDEVFHFCDYNTWGMLREDYAQL